MTIRVLTVESSEWNTGNINQAMLLGEFADESDALTGIWQDLIQKRQHRAYLLFRRHAWVKYWRKPIVIVWGGLSKGMPRIYQEALDQSSEKKADLLYRLAA